MKPPLPRPCVSCPYRRDVPSGIWHVSQYDRLPLYDLPLVEQPTQLFGCHQANGHLCSGWCGTHDMTDNFSIRIAIVDGRIESDDIDKVIDYVSPVPLFSTGVEAAAHGLRDYDNLGPDAEKMIAKLLKKPGVKM